MKKLSCLILLLSIIRINAQTIAPQVINSAGSHRVINGTNGLSITDNVGEPFSQTVQTGTLNNLMITEGFLQPFVVNPGFNVDIRKNDLTCSDKKDGKISISVSTPYHYTAAYLWSPSSVCPGNNCQFIDSLNPGTYSVAIFFTYTTSAGLVKQDSSFKTVMVNDPKGPCRVEIHSAFTPNNDGTNDFWVIGNITSFKSNKVSIFNRWGKEVFNVTGYDNSSKVWGQTGDKLIPSTYFYVIDLGDGSKLIKGWVEVIRD